MGDQNQPGREYTTEQRLFVCLELKKGSKYPLLKEKVYKPLPSNLEELKTRIKREVRNLPESLVRKAVFSMKKRAARVVAEDGGAFEGKAIRL